jgi:ribonuclease R
MEAERETIDRYVAAYLSEHIGTIMPARITGVQKFGFFAQVDGIGGDGLVPAATLGAEYYHWDEASQSLTGAQSGRTFTSGQRLDLRLVEANSLTGALMFALPDTEPHERVSNAGLQRARRTGVPQGRRGRPANIRHQSRRR